MLSTWTPNCIFFLLKYRTSNSLMDMSALPVAINRPSGLKRAHLATFYKIKEIQLSIIVRHLSILIIIMIKVACHNKNIQRTIRSLGTNHLMLWNVTCIMLWKSLWKAFWLCWTAPTPISHNRQYNTQHSCRSFSNKNCFECLCTWSLMNSVGE